MYASILAYIAMCLYYPFYTYPGLLPGQASYVATFLPHRCYTIFSYCILITLIAYIHFLTVDL